MAEHEGDCVRQGECIARLDLVTYCGAFSLAATPNTVRPAARWHVHEGYRPVRHAAGCRVHVGDGVALHLNGLGSASLALIKAVILACNALVEPDNPTPLRRLVPQGLRASTPTHAKP